MNNPAVGNENRYRLAISHGNEVDDLLSVFFVSMLLGVNWQGADEKSSATFAYRLLFSVGALCTLITRFLGQLRLKNQ